MPNEIHPMADNTQRIAEFLTCPAAIDLADDALYGIKQITRSGESMIFAATHRDVGRVAIKIGCEPLVETCSKAGAYADTLDQQVIETVQKELWPDRQAGFLRTEQRLRQLDSFFPAMIRPEDWSLRPVTLSADLLEYSVRSQTRTSMTVPSMPENEYTIETIVRTQPFIPGLLDEDRLSVSTRYAEIIWDNVGYVSEDDYKEATCGLVFNDWSGKRVYSTQELIHIQGSPYLAKLLEKAQGEPKLARSLCQFLESLEGYVHQTDGALVDVIGKDNVIYLHADGVMVDGLYAEDVAAMKGAITAFEAIARGDTPSYGIMNQCLNAMNFMRGMNIIARACSSDTRFYLDIPKGMDSRELLQRTIMLTRLQHGLKGTSRIRSEG